MTGAATLPAAGLGLSELAEQGHCLLPDILPAAAVDAAAHQFRDYVTEQTNSLNGFGPWLGASPTRLVFSLATAPEHIRAFVCSPVLGRIAARALGVPAVRVLQFNGVYKPGGAMATPWHQDLSYMPLDCDAVVTLWMPLAPVTSDMGALMFATGSNHDGLIDLAGVEARYPVAVNPPMRPGDISLHGGWTAHRSAPNCSNRMREAVAISYFPDGARVRSGIGGPPMMATMLAELLPGLKPHDLAQGPTVPLVYDEGTDSELEWDDRP